MRRFRWKEMRDHRRLREKNEVRKKNVRSKRARVNDATSRKVVVGCLLVGCINGWGRGKNEKKEE